MRLNKVLGAFFRWVIVPAAYVLLAFLLLPVLLLLFAMISSRETGQDILITPPGVEEKIPSEVASQEADQEKGKRGSWESQKIADGGDACSFRACCL
ncbi:MAG: hypothetical protein Q3M24_19880 [Candidatus Electrothrix aestuarii]|uniref:Uncharacterized protein n=1 Tax=Candidatus Electrothrix aestuarii TaxID=3062594 RepID=A0AAU8LUH0_9BACT|nr:hypothetical protein [Candidatus Electrothrix aestuarii]